MGNPRNTGRIRLRMTFLPLAAVVLLLLEIFSPHRVWLGLLISLGGAWFIALLWAHSLARRLELIRELRFGWSHVGDLIEERFRLTNAGWAPAVWVEVQDRSSMPSYDSSRVTGVEGHSETHWQTQGLCTRRGVFMLGPTTVVCQDPLGVYTVEKEYPASSTMAVMPPVLPLPMIEIASGGRAGDGRSRSDAPERTVDASGVRDYVPGDSLRWIHWRTSARTGKLHVRLFDGTPVGDWWIFLDLNEPCQVGEGENSTLEHAIVLAASVADRGIVEGRAVGLVAQGGKELASHSPRGGVTQLWAILRTLAMISPGRSPLEDLLRQLSPRESARSSLIVITPDVEGRWLEPLLTIARRGVRPTVILLDPSTYGRGPEAAGISGLLSECGIPNYVLTRDFLDRPDLHPGKRGELPWKITPRGRAIFSEAVDLTWKALS